MQTGRIERELVVLSEKGRYSAPANIAFALSLGTHVEAAQASEITVAPNFHDKNVNLMMCHADVPFVKKVFQGAASGFLECLEVPKVGQPYGDAHVPAFVPDGDARPAEFPESRHFLFWFFF